MPNYISYSAICGFKKWMFDDDFSRSLKDFVSLLD